MKPSAADVRLQLPQSLADELADRACGAHRADMPPSAIAAARGALARSLLVTALNTGALPRGDATAPEATTRTCVRVRLARPLHRELRLRALQADMPLSDYAARLLETALSLRNGRRSPPR